jgi:hypothetical protein
MAYTPRWERLSDALARVIEATGLSQAEAQADICRAIEDGTIDIQGELGTYMHGGTAGSTILQGNAFKVPKNLKAEHLDWVRSRPTGLWLVQREAFRRPGHWSLNWVELFRADVTSALCAAELGHGAIPLASSDSLKIVQTGQVRPVAPGQSGGSGPARRRGPRPVKFERAKNAMKDELKMGRRTVDDLENMLEKDLAAEYGVSRETARKARNAVLLEMNSRQIPTNDK